MTLLVGHGFSLADVYAMTMRQLFHFSRVLADQLESRARALRIRR